MRDWVFSLKNLFGTPAAGNDIKAIDQRMSELELIRKYAETYRQLKPVYDRYRRSRDKEKYLRGHESEIILFEAAARELRRMGDVPIPTTDRIEQELAHLSERKIERAAEMTTARKESRGYETIKKNVDMLLTSTQEMSEHQHGQELE